MAQVLCWWSRGTRLISFLHYPTPFSRRLAFASSGEIVFVTIASLSLGRLPPDASAVFGLMDEFPESSNDRGVRLHILFLASDCFAKDAQLLRDVCTLTLVLDRDENVCKEVTSAGA